MYLKKILKLILPKKFVKYLRGKIDHEGYLLFLFPPLKFFLSFSQKIISKCYLSLKFLVMTTSITMQYTEKQEKE